MLHPGHRPVPGLRGLGGEVARRSTTCAFTISKPGPGTRSRFRSRSTRSSRAARRTTIRRTYRYNYQSFMTPSSVFDYDVAPASPTLLKQQEVLGGYDPTQYATRAAVGHGARRRQSADLDRVQEGLRARRQGAAVPVRLRLATASARRRRSPAIAAEPARSRHGLRDRAHPRRRRDGREVARGRHAHEEEEHLLRLHRLRRIPGQARSGPRRTGW